MVGRWPLWVCLLSRSSLLTTGSLTLHLYVALGLCAFVEVLGNAVPPYYPFFCICIICYFLPKWIRVWAPKWLGQLSSNLSKNNRPTNQFAIPPAGIL